MGKSTTPREKTSEHQNITAALIEGTPVDHAALARSRFLFAPVHVPKNTLQCVAQVIVIKRR